MKKITIIYTIMIFLGLGLIASGVAMGFTIDDAKSFFTDENQYEKADTYVVKDEISELRIDASTKNIMISTNELDHITIDYYEKKIICNTYK